MAFNPEAEFIVEKVPIGIMRFHRRKTTYVVRPPYQRKTVWDTGKKQALLDSLFRRYYIPSIVMREVRLSKGDSRLEVIDGQQRITTVQEFYNDEITLPKSLLSLPGGERLAGKRMSELDDEIIDFIDDNLRFNAEVIRNIDDPNSDRHREIAADIFWRLQQGAPLNKMETAHARLSSLVRNFLVKHADDYDFDYDEYKAIDPNPHKHKFFTETRPRSNTRMQHLTLLGRFLLLELADGPTNLGEAQLVKLIEGAQQTNGIGDQTYEREPAARNTLKTLKRLHEVFVDDKLLDKKVGVVPFRHEYFTISCYLLLRYLINHHNYREEVRLCFRDFVYEFFQRTNRVKTEDENARIFVENTQNDQSAVSNRERVIFDEFSHFARSRQVAVEVETRDAKRSFDTEERVAIWLRDDGLCQMCLYEGKSRHEAQVPFSEFEADHILPHSQGGQTLIENGQVLCREHNRSKGATV